MKSKKSGKPLVTFTLILTISIFLTILSVMTLQSLFMYIYWRFWCQIDIRLPRFWRPIPIMAIMSAIVGTVLSSIMIRIPLKPINQLIDAVNQLASGNFHARIHLYATKEFIKLSESFNSMAQELENTELLRSDFINNFSHEFKTPIVSLCGFAKLLKNSNLSIEERDEYLNIIISESTRLSQLSTNVLNLSKIEKLNILTDMESFNLSEEIRQSVLLLAPKWQKRELEFIIDLEELTYYGNKSLLNQVWINLMDNAIKFSAQKGKIKIKLHKQENNILFQIIDNGCGMSPDTKSKIFNQFYQGDSSHATEGNGLGLTVVKKIINLHNGMIQVFSEKDIGTTFSVTLVT